MCSDSASRDSGLRQSSSCSVVCRGCGNSQTELVVSFGDLPLANALITFDKLQDRESLYPLDLFFCPECTLVQIGAAVSPDEIFSNYPYFSSYADTMLSHVRELAQKLIAERHLGPDSLVVEAASNDGYMLRNFVESGVQVMGVEPADNVASEAIRKGIPTLVRYFDEALAEEMRAKGQAADVMIANNVLAHVPEVHRFVEGFRILLKSDGIAVFETPYVRCLVESLQFDTIYHEHIYYYSLHSLWHLFTAHGLTISDVEQVSVHGGSLRLYVRHDDTNGAAVPGAVARMLAEEKKEGLTESRYYRQMADRISNLRDQLLELLQDAKSRGKSIAAYGAGAKGTTFLNVVGLGSGLIDFVVDRSPHKQGHYLPGSRIPVYAPRKLLELKPDYVLLLTWNFEQEILEQQREFLEGGGCFIIAIPEPRIIQTTCETQSTGT